MSSRSSSSIRFETSSNANEDDLEFLNCNTKFRWTLRNFRDFLQNHFISKREKYVKVTGQEGQPAICKWRAHLRKCPNRKIAIGFDLHEKADNDCEISAKFFIKIGDREFGRDVFQVSHEPLEFDVTNLPLERSGSLVIQWTIIFRKKENRPVDEETISGEMKKNFALHMKKLIDNAEDGSYDLTIFASDRKAKKAHKAILSARSPVFKAMFSHDMKEANSGVVKLNDLSFPALECFLKFIYTGDTSLSFIPIPRPRNELDAEMENPVNFLLVSKKGNDFLLGNTNIPVTEIVNAAKKYEVEDLLTFLDLKLQHSYEDCNAIFLLQLANKFGLKRTKISVENFLKTRPELLLKAFEEMH